MDYKILDLAYGSGADPFSVADAIGVRPYTVAEWYSGSVVANTLTEISGTGRDLSFSGSPAKYESVLLGRERTVIPYYSLTGSEYFYLAAANWMKIYSADFTLSFLVKSPSSAPAGSYDYIFSNNTVNGGASVYMNTSGAYGVYLWKPSASAVNTYYSANRADGAIHLVHIVRSGSTLVTYVDTSSNLSADPTGYGLDVDAQLNIGCDYTLGQNFVGGLIYCRMQTSASTSDERSAEYYYWFNILAGRSAKRSVVPTFSRSVVSMAERVTGSNRIINSLPAGKPVSMAEGGLLIQGDLTQQIMRTNVFDNATSWVNSSIESPAQMTSAGTLSSSYYGIACNASGRYVVIAQGSRYIKYSSDYGVTFSTADLGAADGAHCITMNSAGDRALCASASTSRYIMTSSNYGASWTSRSSPASTWASIACDATGQYCVACQVSGYIYTSTNWGVNWTQQVLSGSRTWTGVTSDATGQYLAACVGSGFIYVSTDWGVNWTAVASASTWTGISSDSTGQYLVACRSGVAEYVYKSDNWGAGWSQLFNNSNYGRWASVTSSPDGQHLVATSENVTIGYICISHNRGSTWTLVTMPALRDWRCCANTSDGLTTYVSPYSATYAFKITTALLACTVTTSATPVSPDGLTTVYSLTAAAINSEHGLVQTFTATASDYTFEVFAAPGDKDWLYLSVRTLTDVWAYFNIRNMTVGSTGSNCTASVNRLRNRCAIHFTALATSQHLQISPAESDGVVAFLGDAATPNVYLWEASCHLTKFQTMPMTRVTSGFTRTADSLTYPINFFNSYFLGNSYHNKYLTIELKVKCQYTSTTDIGANTYRPFLTIGGNTGTASSTKNHISIRAYNQFVYASFYSNDSTTHRYMSHVVTDANRWHVYRVKFDFANLSLSTFTKDGVAYTGSGSLSASHNLDVTNCLLRMGQDNAGTVSGFCEIDYVKIWLGT